MALYASRQFAQSVFSSARATGTMNVMSAAVLVVVKGGVLANAIMGSGVADGAGWAAAGWSRRRAVWISGIAA